MDNRYHSLRLWCALALVVTLIAAAALWLRGALFDGGGDSPMPTPLAHVGSPLRTPTQATATPMPSTSWDSGGAALLWVTLGIGLALCIACLILCWGRRAVG